VIRPVETRWPERCVMAAHRGAILGVALVASAIVGCGGHKSSRLLDPVLTGDPVLLTINGATQPSGPIGSTVILEGSNFGSFQGNSGRVWFSNGTGGSVTATIAVMSDWADDFIVATVPSGAATGPVRVQTVAGVSDTVHFTVTQNAAFSPSTINWTASTPLPIGLSGHAAAVAGPPGGGAGTVVYVLGGADSTGVPRADVYYSPVLPTGQVGAWIPTLSLPGAVAFHAAVAGTPFNSRANSSHLYVLGGATDALGQPTTAIYEGRLNQDGTVSAWNNAGALPLPLHSLGAAIFHGDLYVAGGSTTGNVPVAAVYRARIDTAGALGAWQALTSLPGSRSYHQLLSFAGYLYSLGGDNGTIAPNDSSNAGTILSDAVYAKINLRTGALASQWLSTTSLSKARSKHTAVLGGGYILITAGIYNGAKTGSSEESYCQVNGNGSLGSFNGATGSQTILSAGGKNLFNHAAVGYADGNGTAHIMVIGGDDLNAPGKKRAEVWFY
jgi:hypothetical protein